MGKRNRHHTRNQKAVERNNQEESERVSNALELLMELAHKPTPAPTPAPRPDRTDMHKELLEHHRQRDIKRRNAILAARTQKPAQETTQEAAQETTQTARQTTASTYQDFCSIQ